MKGGQKSVQDTVGRGRCPRGHQVLTLEFWNTLHLPLLAAAVASGSCWDFRGTLWLECRRKFRLLFQMSLIHDSLQEESVGDHWEDCETQGLGL